MDDFEESIKDIEEENLFYKNMIEDLLKEIKTFNNIRDVKEVISFIEERLLKKKIEKEKK